MHAALPIADASIALPRAPRPTRARSADDLRRALRAPPEAPVELDTSGLDSVLRLDTARGLIEVQSAMRWQSLAVHLGHGDAVYGALAEDSTLGETVARTVAINAAGPDGRPFVSHLESLTLVMPDGELCRTSRSINPRLFALAVGGQGLFGALYSVTLRLASLRACVAGAVRPLRLELGPPAPGRGIDVQLLVPPERVEALLAELRVRAEEWRLPMVGVEVRPILPENESVLRWASKDYAALRVQLSAPSSLGGLVRATQVQRAMIGAAIAHGGAFPIASTRSATRAQLDTCFPRLGEFLVEKRRYDPFERLQNEWYRHHCALLRNGPCPPRWST